MSFSFSARTWVMFLMGSLGLITFACSSDKTTVVPTDALISNDFESLAGWVGPTPTLTKEKAHSGRYSIKVDANSAFSLGFNSTLGALHDVRVKRIKVAGWVFVPSAAATAALVTHMGDAEPNTKPLVWDGFDVVKAVDGRFNQWVKVSKVIDVPITATASTNVGIYLWRSSGNEPVYFDDLVVTDEPGA